MKLREFDNQDGSKSPLTSYGDKSFRDEDNFFKKWFTRPFLTNGPTNSNKKDEK